MAGRPKAALVLSEVEHPADRPSRDSITRPRHFAIGFAPALLFLTFSCRCGADVQDFNAHHIEVWSKRFPVELHMQADQRITHVCPFGCALIDIGKTGLMAVEHVDRFLFRGILNA